jgi:CubicO group peptidase (beta-lactamase class C family)
MTSSTFGVPFCFPALPLTRRDIMRRVVGGGLVAAFSEVGGMPENRAAAQSDVATPVATPSLPATLSDATLRDFEADIEAALQTFRVLGAAVALVQGDEIVFNRGFGVRNVASGQSVTPHTRFRIGSITKSMTVLLLATLVDDGVLSWNDRVVDVRSSSS